MLAAKGEESAMANGSGLAAEPGRSWLDRRHLMGAYAVFGAYATVDAIFSSDRDQVWAIWAACGYAVALLLLWWWRDRIAAAGVSVALAVLAPLLWLSAAYPLEDGMNVIDRAAALLLHHGSPYLTSGQITGWLSYNPYLPVMTLFGLPNAAGLRATGWGGLAGNPGVWLAVGTVVPLAAAFWIALPARRRPLWRSDALLATAIAVASPVIGLNLAVITTDPPVLALMLLSLALALTPSAVGSGAGAVSSGAALGVACDLKSTAWLAVPVMAAMYASRDGARAAGRFIAAAVITAVALIVVLAPATLIRPAATAALVQNSVLFPLGLTHDKTPAESLLPGHLLTAMGTAGHVVSVGLLLAAALGIAISLVIRPPRDVPAAARRIALGLTLMFLLGPDVRFGYFLYPLGLLGWLALTGGPPEPADAQVWKANPVEAERELIMRVVEVGRRGGPEVLGVAEREALRPGPGQVVVDVAAAGVNFMDIYQRQGVGGYRPELPFVPGAEGAGTVAAVGEGVTHLSVGDHVAWAGPGGSYAEQVALPAGRVVPVPDGISSQVAAAAILQGMTAHYLVTSTYPVRDGDVAVVHAAAGGVGLLLTQLVKRRGGMVVATTSGGEKAELARGAGADHITGYDTFRAVVDDVTDGVGAHVVYDGVGKDTFDDGLAALRPRGMMVLYGAASGQVPPLDPQRLNSGGSLFLTRPTMVHYISDDEELRWRSGEIFSWIARGELDVRIGGTYPLAQARQAQEDLAARRTTGKLLLLPGL
jgi:NADPH2:quinone reductase